MQNEEFNRTASAELAEFMTERLSETPNPQPVETSVWIAMSMLQKAIRRGEAGHALRAAATLLRDDPDRLWRRLTVAVFEDIGLGSLDLVAPVLAATAGKRVRRNHGGDWAVASALVERLAAARKCRATDDLLMTAIAHPRYESDRIGLSYRTTPELMKLVCENGDIVTQAIALFYSTGTDRCPVPTFRTRKGDLKQSLELMRQAGFPFCVVDLAERGATRFREPLPSFMSLLSRDVPSRKAGFVPREADDDIHPTRMIGDVPSWAVDYYTRPGRVALATFLRRQTPTGSWISKHIPPRRRVEFLGGIAFRVDGGVMRRRLQWPLGYQLRRMMEVEANGFGIADAGEVLDLLRNDLPTLNEERSNVL